MENLCCLGKLFDLALYFVPNRIRVEGIVPALCAFIPCFLAKVSAIWLRPTFSTQTNNMGPLANSGSLEESEEESGN